jgi:hypothetical protein
LRQALEPTRRHGVSFQTTPTEINRAPPAAAVARHQPLRCPVYRLVTGEPQRIPSRTFAALCDIFDCTPNDLFEPYVEMQAAATANAPQPRELGVTPRNPVARRIRIVEDGDGTPPQA